MRMQHEIVRVGAEGLEGTLAAEREIMNFYAPHYRRHELFNTYVYGEARQQFVDWLLAALRRAGKDPAQLSFLEVGVSSGDVLELLAAAGCRRLTGLDLAEGMVEEARRHAPSARIIHGAIEHHDFRGETFDVVIATFTLHHMHDPRAFFRLLERVLTPGGWFFIDDFNKDAWAHSGWTRWVIQGLAKPFRMLLRFKNRRYFARQPQLPALFNPDHHVLAYREILAAIPRPEQYALTRHTVHVWQDTVKLALCQESALDRALLRLLRLVDRLFEPFGGGAFQRIAGRKTS